MAQAGQPLFSQTITVSASTLDGAISFPLSGLPPSVYEDLIVTVQTDGYPLATKVKRFQRAPPPRAGSNISIFSVDHTTGGMLMGQGGDSPWLPFAALGWFNSPFEYNHESIGDMSLIDIRGKSMLDASRRMYVARGGSFATEWGKKGHTLIRIGCDHQRDGKLLLQILDECERAGIYAMYTPSWPNGIGKSNTSADMAGLVSNLTLIKDHPSLWGYYICDDCCKGFDFLWQLAWVYDAIKAIDPYHLTAGFAECGELHAFQEPHLSLDAPIRENYRPEMAYHHNDGSCEHPGSDASLRMPPNTFEPMFNGLQAERQAVGEVARSNAYLGLITAGLLHNNWYVFNEINYVKWQNVAIVDRIFAEFQILAPAVLSPWTTQHPTVAVSSDASRGRASTAPPCCAQNAAEKWCNVGGSACDLKKLGGNIRARAWRDPRKGQECVHLVVVNSVQEGALPEPNHFTLSIGGLSAAEIHGGATPRFGLGCVVNFTQPPQQAYMCRNVPLAPTVSATGSATATLSDYIGVTDTNVYAIGCALPASVADNYVSDPGFEGGASAHPMPAAAGTVGYNLDNHQAYWNIHAVDTDGVHDGHSFDDGSWLRYDSIMPHSGRSAGRVFLPAGEGVRVWLPCERGDEHFTHPAKKDPVKKRSIAYKDSCCAFLK